MRPPADPGYPVVVIGSRTTVRRGAPLAASDEDDLVTAAGALEAAADHLLDEDEGVTPRLLQAAGALEAFGTRHRSLAAMLERRSVAENEAVVAAEAGTDAVDATLVYDGYFGMRRVTALDPFELVVTSAPALSLLTRHLGSSALSIDDKATLASEVAWYARAAAGLDEMTPAPSMRPAPGAARALHPVTRWKLGHVIFALTCRTVAAFVHAASDAYAAGNPDRAERALACATGHLRGVSASMELASASSSRMYMTHVRPSMQPPALGLELSGSMNVDYRCLKRSMARLAAEMGDPFAALARAHRGLALARDDLLHHDLVDHERHIALAHRLVGVRPALDEGEGGSAVQALRHLHRDLLDRYSTMLRHGYMTDGGDMRSAAGMS